MNKDSLIESPAATFYSQGTVFRGHSSSDILPAKRILKQNIKIMRKYEEPKKYRSLKTPEQADLGRFARAFVSLRSKEKLNALNKMDPSNLNISMAGEGSNYSISLESEMEMLLAKTENFMDALVFLSKKEGSSSSDSSVESIVEHAVVRKPIFHRVIKLEKDETWTKRSSYFVVPQEKDLQTLKGVGAEYEGSEMFTSSEYSLGHEHERVQDSYVPKSDLESFAYSDSMISEGSSMSVHKLQERESTQTRDWGELSYGEQVKLLRIGPSCPELLEKTRHIIETKEVEQIDPPLESSHLDYALIMNMLEGNWGVDEDQTIAQITFKYIHDESFRRRLAKECHSIIDECECPAHQTITSEKLMNMDDSCYYDIETEEDKIQVVDKLRKEFKEKYEDEMNMDLERILNPSTDSDENDDYYEEDVKKFSKEVAEDDWLNVSKDVSYHPECPKFRSEEALLNRRGYPERPEKIKIRRLRMKDLVKAKEKKNIEEVVQSAYNLKINQFRIDDFKGVKWRPRKTYVYRKPNWTKLDPKHDSFIDEQNKEDVK